MDNKIYQDDELEQFLQNEVKQHRIYPSDHIWKNIRTELHGYKAWPALTFISLFIITALTISTLLNNHPTKQLPVPAEIPVITSIAVKHSGGNAGGMIADAEPEKDYFQQIAPEQITAETFASLNLNETIANEALVLRNSSIDNAALPVKTITHTASTDKAVTRQIPASGNMLPATIQNTMVAEPAAEAVTNTESTDQQPVDSKEEKATEQHATADDFLKDFNYITNKPNPKNSRFGFQFYVTPSNSYRRLSDQKVKEIIQPAIAATTAAQNVPLTANSAADVNNVVRHKPAIGFELGFALLYNMTGRLKFKTGVQLNVRQYYIETFQSTNDLASISLINYRGIETINFYSPYNNNTGYRKTQLDNKLYQLSVPLGVQWEALKGKHFGISTEASVQPTLTLNNNTYLLSTDYKHYTGGGDFIRKWNINTSVGFNLTYTNGASSWQLGPQVRYQHLPTYTNLYPIKEYLVDYGVRLGFTRQIK
ncbi:MAG: hypothetical protein V4450_08560 [Bacteroidota bacterium]